MPSECTRTLSVKISLVPLFSLTFQNLLHGSASGGAHLLVHPIESHIDELESRLRSASLEEAGILLSITRSRLVAPILSVLVDFLPPPKSVNEVIDRVNQIVRALIAP